LLLSKRRDAQGAERFFRKALRAKHTAIPRVITVDKNVAYPPTFAALPQDGTLPETCTLRQSKYVNNVVEQDHRLIKRRVNPGPGFGSFATAMHMIRKGQLAGIAKRDILAPNRAINQLFGLAA
jgi:transposase, IS6 family